MKLLSSPKLFPKFFLFYIYQQLLKTFPFSHSFVSIVHRYHFSQVSGCFVPSIYFPGDVWLHFFLLFFSFLTHCLMCPGKAIFELAVQLSINKLLISLFPDPKFWDHRWCGPPHLVYMVLEIEPRVGNRWFPSQSLEFFFFFFLMDLLEIMFWGEVYVQISPF